MFTIPNVCKSLKLKDYWFCLNQVNQMFVINWIKTGIRSDKKYQNWKFRCFDF